MPQDNEMVATDVRVGQTPHTYDLHLSRGMRGYLVDKSALHFAIHPIISGGPTNGLGPYTIGDAEALCEQYGSRILGLDDVSGGDSPLPARIWRPRCAFEKLQAADLWSNVFFNLGEAERTSRQAALARHISTSLRAAGIRIRDASDHYRRQLRAAVAEKREDGSRFSNIPLADIRLALHSILSELSSARDYLAAWFARQLGAPENVDALARLVRWLPGNVSAEDTPIALQEMLGAFEADADDPWARRLTQFRNLHLHREPLGSGMSSKWLVYKIESIGDEGVCLPTIIYPIGDAHEACAGRDYLEMANELFEKLGACAEKAARSSGISCEIPKVNMSSSGRK